MSFSFTGGQLPLTAFFDPRVSQQPKRKSTQHKLSKGSSAQERGGEPPRKRQKQKENFTPPASKRVGVAYDKQAGSSRRRASPRDAKSVVDLVEDESVEVFTQSEALSEGVNLRNEAIAVHSPPVGPAIKSNTSSSSYRQAPATPKPYGPPHSVLAATSLPSPPLTVPAIKRVRSSYHEQTTSSNSEHRASYSDHEHPFPDLRKNDTFTPGSRTVQVVGDKDAIVLRPPQNGIRMTMPPPPLPRKVNSSTMPTRPALRPPRSSSSERWVPSSQTQELSIPRFETGTQTSSSPVVPHTPIGQSTQVIPSSQSNERELRMSDVLDMAPDVCRTPDSPLQRCRSPVSPSLLDSEAERDTVVSPPSPDFVESSQSQSEHELSASWAEVIGLRRAALMRPNLTDDYSPSSPSRPAESQDYDAHDEYSQSQGSYSQASTFAHSELHSSPLCGASQFTDASSSSSLTPYSEVPSQFLDFLSMFENRDEFGNELPAPVEGLSRSAFAPPITREQTCSRASPPSHAYGSPSSPRRDLEDAAPGSSDEVMEESQLGESQSYAEDSDYGSSDIPDVYPTPVRDFLAMFEESQQPAGISP